MLMQSIATEYLRMRQRLSLEVTSAGVAAAGAEWRGCVSSPPHSRLYFVLDGEFFVEGRDGERHIFSAGKACLIPAGYSYRFGCERYMRQAYLHLRLCGVGGVDMLGRCGVPREAEFSGCERVFDLLACEGEADVLRTEAAVFRALEALLPEGSAGWATESFSPEVERAIEYVLHRPSVALRVSDIAREVHTAESTLAKRFRREVGMSVGEYVDAQVMRRAERELRLGALSVGEISRELGFCDQFYFSRRFKEKYGRSPLSYRKDGAL